MIIYKTNRPIINSTPKINCFKVNDNSSKFTVIVTTIRSFRNEEMKPKCFPQLFLGLLLGTRRSAIGQFFSLSFVTVPEVFAKVNSAQSSFRF